METKGKFTGPNGAHYVFQKTLVVWDSRSYKNSMMQCLLNKCGGFSRIKPLFSTSSSKLSSFPMVVFLMQRKTRVPLLGGLFSKVGMSYQRGLNGEWETVKTFLSSRTVGCLTLKTLKSNPFQPFWVVMLKFLF